MLRTELRLVLVALLVVVIPAAVVLARPKDLAKRQERMGDTFLCKVMCESVEESSEEGCDWLDYIDGTKLCEQLCKSSSVTTQKPLKKPEITTKSPLDVSSQLGGSTRGTAVTTQPQLGTATTSSLPVTPQFSTSGSSAQSDSTDSALPLGASTTGGTTPATSSDATTNSTTTTDSKGENVTEESKKARQNLDDTTEALLSKAAKDRLLQYLPQMLDFWCDWAELFPKPDSAAARATLCPLRTGPVNGTRLDPPALLDLILSDFKSNRSDKKIEER